MPQIHEALRQPHSHQLCQSGDEATSFQKRQPAIPAPSYASTAPQKFHDSSRAAPSDQWSMATTSTLLMQGSKIKTETTTRAARNRTVCGILLSRETCASPTTIELEQQPLRPRRLPEGICLHWDAVATRRSHRVCPDREMIGLSHNHDSQWSTVVQPDGMPYLWRPISFDMSPGPPQRGYQAEFER